jgi:hypothetical protein
MNRTQQCGKWSAPTRARSTCSGVPRGSYRAEFLISNVMSSMPHHLAPISVALGAVKREQLDNLVHAQTTVHEVRSDRMNAFELTLIGCL